MRKFPLLYETEGIVVKVFGMFQMKLDALVDQILVASIFVLMKSNLL